MELKSYPLCWPDGWKRNARRERAKFGKSSTRLSQTGETLYDGRKKLTVSDSLGRISDSLSRMGISENSIIVSTNIPTRLDGLPRSGASEPLDPGAAVYWKHKGKQECMAIDRYDRVADNLAAIAATLEALRAIQRHGGGEILERAFRGFAALPSAIITARPWRDVLGIAESVMPAESLLEVAESRFKLLARSCHSDTGGTDGKMRELIQARDAARQELV